MQRAPLIEEQSLIRHFVSECVPERVLEVRKESDLVEELGSLQLSERRSDLALRCLGDSQQQGHGHVLTDDGSRPSEST